MRIQKAGNEPIYIALEKFDQPVIRINPAPFLAGERLGWRKFLSSLYDEIPSSGGCFWASPRALPVAPVGKKIFCPKLFPETTH